MLGDGNRHRAGKVATGHRRFARGNFRGLAGCDQVAAGAACAGAEVHNEIGAANSLFVVLDDEHGVAEIAQAAERLE